jgi:hypothetical protein
MARAMCTLLENTSESEFIFYGWNDSVTCRLKPLLDAKKKNSNTVPACTCP